MHKEENGLTLPTKIKSSAKTGIKINDLKEIGKYIISESFVVAYLYNEVLIGKYNDDLSFPEGKTIESKFIKRIRIFSRNEELLIWRSNGILKGRFRTDNEGKETKCIEADQILYGTKAEYKTDYTILTENRGTRITVPGKWIADNKRSRVAIRTRHYIGYKNDYQATYIDARFVKFVQLPEGGE